MENFACIENLAHIMVSSLVDYPDDLALKVSSLDNILSIKAFPHRSDVGKVIGRSGRNAESIRTVLSGAGTRLGLKVLFDIIEERYDTESQT